MVDRGIFITLEGGEGSGKTTQSQLLFDALNAAGIAALHTREPGGTDGAEEIRDLLVNGETGRWDKITETLMYFAARRDHVHKLISPSLNRGEWVICDRFTDSTIAYQCYGEGVSLELVHGLNKIVLADFMPDITFLFDINPVDGIGRAHSRRAKKVQMEDRYERMGTIFHKNVRRGFLEIAKEENERVIVIPGDSSVQGIHNNVIDGINDRFNLNVKPIIFEA